MQRDWDRREFSLYVYGQASNVAGRERSSLGNKNANKILRDVVTDAYIANVVDTS